MLWQYLLWEAGGGGDETFCYSILLIFWLWDSNFVREMSKWLATISEILRLSDLLSARLTVTEGKEEWHFSRQHSGVLMMRSHIFSLQPLPTRLPTSTNDKEVLVGYDMPFFHSIEKFHLLAQKNKNHLYFTINRELILLWNRPFLNKSHGKSFFWWFDWKWERQVQRRGWEGGALIFDKRDKAMKMGHLLC